MVLLLEDLDQAAWRREVLGAPPDGRGAAVARFLATIPPQKRWDPRVRAWVDMIGAGPWHPQDVTSRLSDVNDAIVEAEHEMFVDVNMTEPTVVWFYDRAVARTIGVEIPGEAAVVENEVVRLAGQHNVEVVIVDETGVGMAVFQHLVDDAGYSTAGPRRPWIVKPLHLLDQMAAARRG